MATPKFCAGKCHIRGGDHRHAIQVRTGILPGCNKLETQGECENAWACIYGNKDDIYGNITCNLPYGGPCHWNGSSCALAGSGSGLVNNCDKNVDYGVCQPDFCASYSNKCYNEGGGGYLGEGEAHTGCNPFKTQEDCENAWVCVYEDLGDGLCGGNWGSSCSWELGPVSYGAGGITLQGGSCVLPRGGHQLTHDYAHTDKYPHTCPHIECCSGVIGCDGVCNSGLENDCSGACGGNALIDCHGQCGGSAIVDECGVCGGDESSCADCAGVPNGESDFDVCGVCNGDGTSCEDCMGVPNGGAVIDDCGVCNGVLFFGNDPGDLCECPVPAFPYGKFLDECGNCGGDEFYTISDTVVHTKSQNLEGPLSLTAIDISSGGVGQLSVSTGVSVSTGAFSGLSSSPLLFSVETRGDLILPGDQCACAGADNSFPIMDDCGTCGGGVLLGSSEGNTCSCSADAYGIYPVIDACGLCDGDGTTCADCAGTPYGLFQLDSFNNCCDTRSFGNDINNICGCDDGMGNQPIIDSCRVCGGDNTSCMDCAGVINGDTQVDNCGECGGGLFFGTNPGENCGCGGEVIDHCGVCNGGITDCSSCWSPCTSLCEIGQDRTWISERGATQPSLLCSTAPKCLPNQGGCLHSCEGIWGIRGVGGDIEDNCDSNCNEEYFITSPSPHDGQCEAEQGDTRYCQSGSTLSPASECPPATPCSYEQQMGECYDCNFDNSGNFIDSNNGLRRKEYNIRMYTIGDSECIHDEHTGTNIPLVDGDPYVNFIDGNIILREESSCEDNPSCISCKSFNQLRDEEGFTTKEEFCNNIFLDIMRINCNGEGVTSRSYNIDNIDVLRKFVNINKGNDPDYDIIKENSFNLSNILKNKPMECFHNFFEGEGLLCENIFTPDDILGSLKYNHNLNVCIDDDEIYEDSYITDIMERVDSSVSGHWFQLDLNELVEPFTDTNEYRRGGYVDSGLVEPCPVGTYHMYEEVDSPYYNNFLRYGIPWSDTDECIPCEEQYGCYTTQPGLSEDPECVYKKSLIIEDGTIDPNEYPRGVLNCSSLDNTHDVWLFNRELTQEEINKGNYNINELSVLNTSIQDNTVTKLTVPRLTAQTCIPSKLGVAFKISFINNINDIPINNIIIAIKDNFTSIEDVSQLEVYNQGTGPRNYINVKAKLYSELDRDNFIESLNAFNIEAYNGHYIHILDNQTVNIQPISNIVIIGVDYNADDIIQVTITVEDIDGEDAAIWEVYNMVEDGIASTEQEEELFLFEQIFREDMARTLDINPNQIEILGISQGNSSNIDFRIIVPEEEGQIIESTLIDVFSIEEDTSIELFNREISTPIDTNNIIHMNSPAEGSTIQYNTDPFVDSTIINSDMASTLQEWLIEKGLESPLGWVKCYDSNIHSTDDATVWHSQCDEYDNTIVIAKNNTTHYIFGGYTGHSWRPHSEPSLRQGWNGNTYLLSTCGSCWERDYSDQFIFRLDSPDPNVIDGYCEDPTGRKLPIRGDCSFGIDCDRGYVDQSTCNSLGLCTYATPIPDECTGGLMYSWECRDALMQEGLHWPPPEGESQEYITEESCQRHTGSNWSYSDENRSTWIPVPWVKKKKYEAPLDCSSRELWNGACDPVSDRGVNQSYFQSNKHSNWPMFGNGDIDLGLQGPLKTLQCSQGRTYEGERNEVCGGYDHETSSLEVWRSL